MEMHYRGTFHGGASYMCLTAQGKHSHWACTLILPSYGPAGWYVPKQSHR